MIKTSYDIFSQGAKCLKKNKVFIKRRQEKGRKLKGATGKNSSKRKGWRLALRSFIVYSRRAADLIESDELLAVIISQKRSRTIDVVQDRNERRVSIVDFEEKKWDLTLHSKLKSPKNVSLFWNPRISKTGPTLINC